MDSPPFNTQVSFTSHWGYLKKWHKIIHKKTLCFHFETEPRPTYCYYNKSSWHPFDECQLLKKEDP